MAATQWIPSSPKPKRSKIFLFGPPGSYKTRTMLRLAEPGLAVIDTEFGTQHYGDFNFVYNETIDPDEVMKLVQNLIKNPGKIKTIGIDTFSVYYEALVSKYADLFLKREVRSAGHKGEYYTLQPRDYQPINREASKLVRLLMKCDLNVIVTCQVKDQWGDNMKVIGSTHDGWKRLPYYFDTPIEIKAHKNSFQAICSKDRSHHLEVGKPYPWGNDEEAYKLISGAFGKDLIGGVAKKTESKAKEKSAAVKDPLIDSDQNLLVKIVALKKELAIIDRDVWMSLLKPHDVVTAKEMSSEQLAKFVTELEALRPTPAPAG